MNWDRDTLALLDREREVDIATRLPDDGTQRTTIWVVVDRDEAFIRSWRGARAKWFQAALDRPTEVELIVADQRLPVRVALATDDLSVARCSSALERKYAGSDETGAMVREEILETTLRLEPR
ncbi:hypothetical protein BH23CHL7_BH23CHL7_03810 [soil metagenome]